MMNSTKKKRDKFETSASEETRHWMQASLNVGRKEGDNEV